MIIDVTNIVCTACSLVVGWVYNRSRDTERRADETEKALDALNLKIVQMDATLSERRNELDTIKIQIKSMADDIRILLSVPVMVADIQKQLGTFVPRQEIDIRFKNIEQRRP